MLDLKRIRRDFDEVLQGVMKRGKGDFGLLEMQKLEQVRREKLQIFEEKKARQNSDSRLIPKLKKEGKDTTELMQSLKVLAEEIQVAEKEMKEIDEKVQTMLLYVPNVPHENIPIGKGEEDNVEIRRFGTPRVFDFEPQAHWDLGEKSGMLDFERATKVSGSRFTFVRRDLAKLERALMNYYLDFHADTYEEINAPVLVNRDSMVGTGQLPKFQEDMYHVTEDDLFLIPTAEVSLTNLYRDEILSFEDLPIYVTGFTQCFRREAGSAGRDTRGIIRQHQFGKVELVKFVRPEKSFEEQEDMVSHVEKLIQSLGIPYRVVELCSADLTFSSARTYDIEVWFPSSNSYREISSISNFLDYQARRANIRFRDENGKVEFVHTLNGSGIPTGRMLACIMENYQTEDGHIVIPEVLRPYMNGKEEI
ncbi:serine--tRNA ligase [Guggenheimella bovis]